jgi:hypothetical protein
MADALLITTKSLGDAERIARELQAFGSAVGEVGETWTVIVPPTAKVGEVLSALETCLGENGIDAVSITVDGRTYVMEPAQPPAR